jgi:hypothetical protein
MPTEGQTATGPGGQKAVFRGGQWVVVPAQGGPAPVTLTQGNPTALPQAQADLSHTQTQNALDSAALPFAADTAQAQRDKAIADAAKAQADAAATIKEQAAAPDPGMSRIQRALQTDSVLGAINTARQQIGDGWSTGNVFGTGAFQAVPVAGQNSTNLSATISGIQGAIINDTLAALKAASANGASGYGSLTESEAQRLAAAVGALQQTQDADSLRDNLARVERHYRNALALLNNEDPRDAAVAEKYGVSALPVVAGGEDGVTPGGGLTSEGKFVDEPALRGVNAKVREMIESGADAGQIRGYLNSVQPGLGSASGIDEAVNYFRQNPGGDRPVNIDLEKRWQPNSGVTQTLGDIGMSPIGAAAIGAGDVASFGLLDNMTGNPDLTRAVMGGVSDMNPNAYLAGQIVGGLAGGLGLEAGLARGGLSAARSALGANALVGGAYGAGSADDPGDSRVAAALLGGGAGAAGGKLGELGARGVGRAAAGVSDVARELLNGAGVPMTPGQILGGGAKRWEDRLSGLPLVGDAITARRREGFEGFNQAVLDEALAPIGATTNGEIGAQGAAVGHRATSQAYQNALGGVEVVADEQFENSLLDAVNYLRSVPRVGDEAVGSLAEVVSPEYFTGQTLSGVNMQPMVQEIRGLGRSYRQDPLGHRVSEGMRRAEGAVTGMFERQAPEVMPAYRAADEAYRNFSVADDAILKALSGQGGVFTPAQLGQSARSNTIRYGGKRAAAEGDMPFFELQQAAQEVLPSSIPDSGTAGRVVIPLLAGSLAGGGSYVAQDGTPVDRGMGSAATASVAALLAAAPYSATARNSLQRLMFAERPEMVERTGQFLLDNADIARLLAAPPAVLAVSN